MTDYYVPPAYPPTMPQPKRAKWPWFLGGGLGLVALLGIVAAVVLVGTTTKQNPCANPAEHVPCVGAGNTWVSADGKVSSRDSLTGPITSSPSIAPYIPPAIPTVAPPTADKFKVDLKTTSKQCFGSAGCNVTVEPAISYSGPASDLEPFTCDITYRITGDESGEVIETAYGTGGTGFRVDRSLVSTKSSKTKVTAALSEVTCR